MGFDTKWFERLIERSKYGSQRQLAKAMVNRHGRPMDPSSLHNLLHGTKCMQLDEARQLADLLGVTIMEVIRHAGVRVECKCKKKA